MPSSTAKGFPYPVGTDLLADGDNAIQSLAEAVDSKVGAMATGQVVIAITATTTPMSATVTFPAGRFTAAPRVLCTAEFNSPNLMSPATANGITTTGAVIWISRLSGGNTGYQVSWLAIQNG